MVNKGFIVTSNSGYEIFQSLACICPEAQPGPFANIYDALRDLVLLVQFEKREKHPWWSVTLSLQLY